MNVKNVFLNYELVEEEVYIEKHEGFDSWIRKQDS